MERIHIPAFGNWDYQDELPITQYFESARQAGLIRYSCGEDEEEEEEMDLHTPSYSGYQQNHAHMKPTTVTVVPAKKMNKAKGRYDGRGYREGHVKEQRRQGKVYDEEQTIKQQPTAAGNGTRGPKAVDEDLYKIPPELLYTTYYPKKKKKRFGFFGSCIMPSCVT